MMRLEIPQSETPRYVGRDPVSITRLVDIPEAEEAGGHCNIAVRTGHVDIVASLASSWLQVC